MGLKELQEIKANAGQPKVKKVYTIPKVSAKRKKQIEADKETFEQDKIFYAEVWAASPHICQSCGCNLGKEPLTLFFHHLLPKARYPHLRHVPENIVIICPDCHQQTHSDLDKVPKVKARTEEAKRLLL